ncbi:MAG TPA: helix-turn-helix transcriptional regulator [Acidimicrobiales bacterium]
MPPDTTPLRLALGARVRARRAELDLTQEELAFAAGLNRTQIGEIERGILNTGVDNLARLAGGLGLDLGALLADLGSDHDGGS